MTKQTILTGITTTGTPHLGNYVGAIRPAIALSHNDQAHAFYFLADYHALIKCREPERIRQSSLEVAATWLALGLDTDRAVFYRQSDIPEISELNWLLTCVTAKGLMNRAHAYKAAVAENEQNDSADPDKQNDSADPDKGITMGLFGYPVLMAADILLFNAHKVPVGKDQIQHIEMARDIAGRFNHIYGEHFVIPEPVIDDNTATLLGLDGRKMSKSYNNIIPLFAPEKQLKKTINKIKTNSQLPGEPKDPEQCTLFSIYRAFATAQETQNVRQLYAEGIAWGDMKALLFDYINEHITPARERYQALIDAPHHIEEQLQEGARKARLLSQPFMQRLKEAVGIARVAP
ncbi:MAG: tryptophan--tRNA ligase [Methylococcales bacterium]|nr:tryptophan--tRNA ligase [Methylococcales bacterium]